MIKGKLTFCIRKLKYLLKKQYADRYLFGLKNLKKDPGLVHDKYWTEI